MSEQEQCQYKIRYTWDTDAQCERQHHIDQVVITEEADGRFHVTTIGDGVPGTELHHAKVGPKGESTLQWYAGDRREFTGEWPGPCTGKVPGCVLHTGHYGNCAP